MIKSIKDNVCNNESQELMKAIQNQKTELYGDIEIHENPNSGYIYAADEDCSCYLFSDNENKVLEQHISCPNCGYENFVSEFKNEAIGDCCKEYAKDMGLVDD